MGHQETLDKLVADKAAGGITADEKAEIARQSKKFKDANVNLAYARHAVAFILGKISQVANWDEPYDTSAEGVLRTTGSVQKSVQAWNSADRCVYGELRQKPDWQRINNQDNGVGSLDDIRTLSGLADSHGCGNCGEMTARTFMFLYDLGVRPLDFMVLKKPADHAFVVIGRDSTLDNDSYGAKWGDAAVVCDPWAHGRNKPLPPGTYGALDTYGPTFSAYSAKLLAQKMKVMHSGFSGVTVSVSV